MTKVKTTIELAKECGADLITEDTGEWDGMPMYKDNIIFHNAGQLEAFAKELQGYGEPVAYGILNTAITGKSHKLMSVRLEVPSDDQYGGALWEPLFLAPPKPRG